MKKLFQRVRVSVSISVLATLGVGLALTALLFTSVRQVESERNKVQFEQSAKLRTAAVATGLGDAVEQLVVLNQLFNTMGIVNAEQFRLFTTPLLQRYPQIQALSFQRVVGRAERAAYESAMRRRLPDFSITEVVDRHQRRAAPRDSHNVVEYIQPPAGNETAIGLDMRLDADQSRARAISRATGRVTATGLLTLAQQNGWHTGFLLVAPVYGKGADKGAQATRAIIGETAALFRIDHLIDNILGAGGFLDTPGVSISIYAGAVADARNLAFRQGTAAPAPPAMHGIPRWILHDRSDAVTETFNVAGSPWHMVVSQAPVPFTYTHNGSLFALLGGLLSALLATAYVYALVSRAATITRITGERTAALQFANLRLSEDIALRMNTEKALRLRERIIEVSGNAIIICGASGPDYAIEYVNPAFERITGHRSEEVVGQSLESLQSGIHDQQNLDNIRLALTEKREGRAMLRNIRKDGTPYWNELFVAPVQDDQGDVSHFVVAQYDLTAAMGYEAELEFQARHDVVTGLANRNLLRERLRQAIANARRSGASLWVVYVDLDRFKSVNDTLGHDAGDLALKEITTRIQSCVREYDTVARTGGDEFVLVLPDFPCDGNGAAVLERILAAVAQPLAIEQHEFFLTCSIGVAAYPLDGDTAEILTKHADIAMYRAKEMGRNTYQLFNDSMNTHILDRRHLEQELRQALERDQLSLHYQPQVSLRSGAIVGMEALIRWNHPVLGMISPVRFIRLAEDMGLIVPIGAWVMRTACLQARAWQQAGFGDLRVAVNLSARQFTEKSLVQSITDILAETGLAPRYLELELTESMVMNDVDSAISVLRNLKALGIHISLDDFGTGYSSLSYLRRFPLDVLKIDQSFINDLTSNADDAAAIVALIISLGHSLRMQVIAEGVETPEQLAFLRKHGCDQVQGYYFSRPLEAGAFERLLIDGKCLPAAIEADLQHG